MSKKGGNFFEEHIEKIVLTIVGIVCIWLLVTRVLFSSNKVPYDGGKFGPGEIDNHISEQAKLLEGKLNRPPEPKPAYDPCFPSFVALFNSAINIDVSSKLLQPPHISQEVSDNRKYRIPLIGSVNDVSVEHIRAVAYVPTAEIDEEHVYDEDGSEPSDIDFVTVEAKFDAAQLYKNFNESFAGDDVPEEWRDPCLAKPVFAAVQLQRQELLADGSWSDWQSVPQTKISHRKKMFEVIEEVEKLPQGAMKVRLLQFDDAEMRMDLLQPEAYGIASAEEEWFPPSVHKEYVEYQKQEEAKERREAIEAEKKEREQERERERQERERMGRGRGLWTGELEREDYGGRMGRGREPRARGRRPRTRERFPRARDRDEREREEERLAISLAGGRGVSETTSISDFYDQHNKILVTERSDLAKMREPLVFWAHDDTVEPEKDYRYRIRLGVFNPIAGTDQFSEQDKSQKNNVILWSEFSYANETVEVPATLYFFPHDIQEAAKIVTVTVCRYVLGYWYSKDFTVKQGEVIGKVDEPEIEKVEVGVTVPETIDYATGAVLVDSVRVNDWAGGRNLRPRIYYDMLYSFDGTNIEHRPIRMSCWTKELRIEFSKIKEAEKKPKEPLRGWGSRPDKGRRRAPRRKGEKFEDMEEEEEREALRRMME